MRAALLAVFCLTACVDETSQTEQDETVLEPPTASAFCSSGCGGGHIVGQPFTVYTEFQGLCKTGWEYPCEKQDYTVSVRCTAPCTSAGASFHGSGSIEVVPLTQDPMSIIVTMTREVPAWGGEYASESTTKTIVAGPSFKPDRLEIECTTGDHPVPCATDRPNKSPVVLTLTLFAGTQPLVPQDNAFVVESSMPGGLGWGGNWFMRSRPCSSAEICVTASGHLDAVATYGDLASDPVSFDVEYLHLPYSDGSSATRSPTSSSAP